MHEIHFGKGVLAQQLIKRLVSTRVSVGYRKSTNAKHQIIALSAKQFDVIAYNKTTNFSRSP